MLEQTYGFNHYPTAIATEIDIPDLTVPQLLQSTAATHPDRDAITFYGHTVKFKELYGAANAFAAALQQAGFKKGDRIAIMLPNCPQFIISYYGILMAGGIVTQLNPMLVERELQYILNDSGAAGIIVLDAIYPRIKAIQASTAVKTVVVVSLQQTEATFVPDTPFDAFLRSATAPLQPVQLDPREDLAVLQYTGGTTGRSKGAMLTHRNLVANVLQSQEFFKNDLKPGEERCLTVIPLFHVFGMTSCMNLCISMATTMILLPRFDLQEVLATIQREKPTTFPGVPTMYVAITNQPRVEQYGVDSIRLCNSGSAPMPLEVMRDFERKTGAKIVEGYGLSEAAPVTHCNPTFAERKPGSIGIGFPSTEYKVVDLDTGLKEVLVGEMGELVVRGPQVMKGYWNLPEETDRALRGGWLYTGDIATMDADGYVYIVDRKKDLIIASGYNVYPREVEEVIYEHPAVKEAVVIGVPDPYRGETVKALVVRKDGVQVTEEDIMTYCKANMAPYKVPKLVEFRDALPKTPVGKILRRVLREEASSGQ